MFGFSCLVLGTWQGALMSVDHTIIISMIAELMSLEPSVSGCRSRVHPSSTFQSWILIDIQWGSSWSRVRLSLCVGRNFGDIHQSSRVGIHVSPSSLYHPCARAYTLQFRAPTAGGQYHWVSMLAPQYCQKLFSYVTGKWHLC